MYTRIVHPGRGHPVHEDIRGAAGARPLDPVGADQAAMRVGRTDRDVSYTRLRWQAERLLSDPDTRVKYGRPLDVVSTRRPANRCAPWALDATLRCAQIRFT